MEVKHHYRPTSEKVSLVASLPDMGNVGALVGQFLVSHLRMTKPFAEIDSYDKPFVLCKDGLIAEVPSIYSFHFSEKANLVVMTGDSQPEERRELYDLCGAALDTAASVGRLQRVYTCGGYHREALHGEPKVYGVSNNPLIFQELDRLGIREIGSDVSSITWFNGVILGVAKRRGIDAVGLYGELTDPRVPQPDAANAVLRALTTLLSLPQIGRKVSAP